MGQTPFHSFEMKDLIAKINAGRYTICTKEPLSIECALFLSQCLQANESDRINFKDLLNHPFIQTANDYTNGGDMEGDLKLTILDQDAFLEEIIHATELHNTSGMALMTQASKQSFYTRTELEKNELVLSTQE